jgi:ABC-type antimicrobial peptide transport system permease subunit
MVVADALRLIACGLAAGTAAALAVGRVAESLLFDLRPNDPAALLTACLLLGATGIAAALIPAARAARLEPVIALRSE